MICHTDAVAGNRTTRDNDDEDTDGDEDHGSSQRRVHASTNLDDVRMRGSLEADDKARTNKRIRCRAVASSCPVERWANVVVVVVDGLPTFVPIVTDRRSCCDVQQQQYHHHHHHHHHQQQQQQEQTREEKRQKQNAKARARRNLRSPKAYSCCRGQLRRLPGVG
ncbi:hypothetical protein APICC_04699 [Apis cerana cerana]|uniref:Uncharacterized protein n=1 Tax=Apis cerana cerana TaxID=94128 RepID=A0A2A3E577_APICC|nr:hypothetical protein APICC_04699 [Apis cerana cerana]